MNYNTNEIEKAYFAGLFDGEGSVYIHKGKTNRNGIEYTSYSLTVSFGITYAPILYKLRKIFGGSVNVCNMEKIKKQPSTSKLIESGYYTDERKQSYNYSLQEKNAWIFLKSIYPYCEEKKEKIRVAIEFFEGKRTCRGGNKGRSKSETERCEFYYIKIKELTKNNIVKNDNTSTDNQSKISFFCEE